MPILLLTLVCGVALEDRPPPGAGYPPVQAERLIAARFNHYHINGGGGRDADFVWKFEKDRFQLKKDKAAIPRALLDVFVGADVTPEQITGSWSLEDGKTLVLTNLRIDGKVHKGKVKMPINHTAPSVIRIGGISGQPHQYVFFVQFC